jgi:hypothetical protein
MEFLAQLAYHQILGKPLIIYMGILTILLFFATAAVPILKRKGFTKIPYNLHPFLAKIALASAVIHAILAISVYF